MNLVLGVGLTSSATADDVWQLADAALAEIGARRADITRVATIGSRASHPTITALDRPVIAFSAQQLAVPATPASSRQLMTRIATPSVAEAAALLASASDRLIVERRASRRVVIAIAVLATVGAP